MSPSYIALPTIIPSMLLKLLAFLTSSIDETPPDIITGEFEIFATFEVSSKFGLSLVPSFSISVKINLLIP